MIITAEQLKAINEASMSNVMGSFNGSRNDLNAKITQTTSNMQKNGGVGTFMNQNNPTGPTIALSPSTTDQEIAKAGQVISNTGTSTEQTPGIMESRYSKRQVELGRMLEMRRTGKVYSKKQLNEMFFESENISSLIGSCSLSDIFSAANILSYDGEERLKDAFMSGADFNAVLDELYANADEEAQEEFKEELGI